MVLLARKSRVMREDKRVYRSSGFLLLLSIETSIIFWTYAAIASPNRTRQMLFKIILFRSKMDQYITVI